MSLLYLYKRSFLNIRQKAVFSCRKLNSSKRLYLASGLKIYNFRDNHKNDPCRLLGPQGVVLLSLLTIYYLSGSKISSCSKDESEYNYLSVSAFSRVIRQPIEILRFKLKDAKKQTPTIHIGSEGSIHARIISMAIDPSNNNCDFLALVTSLSQIINTVIDDKFEDDLIDFYSNKDRFKFLVKTNKGQLLIKKVKGNADNPLIEFILKKSTGFLEIDAFHIIQAYKSLLDDMNHETTFGFNNDHLDISNENDYVVHKNDEPRWNINPHSNMLPNYKNDNDNNTNNSNNRNDALSSLKSLGVEIFDPNSNDSLSWDNLAGYAQVKRQIEETIVNPLKHPEVHDKIALATREVFESSCPKAVLLEGPPGTGKTLTARILASQCNRPLVIINLENILSKWYGDSEKKLGKALTSFLLIC